MADASLHGNHDACPACEMRREVADYTQISRADAWRHIGITPDRGRSLQARNAHSLDWPIWFTLRHAALEK